MGSFFLLSCESGSKRRLEVSLIDKPSKRMRLETTSINQLPNEMLLEIFTRMDQQTLLSSLQVNKRWLQIISQTPATMKQMPLLLNGNYLYDQKPPKFTRKYQSMTISDNSWWNRRLFKALSKIQNTVTELHLYDCVFYGNDLTDLLTCLPLVKTLSIVCCSLAYPPINFPQKVAMRKLTELTIQGEAWVLDSILCQLEKMCVSQIYHEEQHHLIDFLNWQSRLKSLSLHSINDLFCPRYRNEIVVFYPKFQLRDLSLMRLSFADGNQLIKLLSRAHSCETLSMGYDIPPIALQYVLKNFHNLRSLDMGIELLPTHRSFYYGLKPNTKLTHLRIDGILESNEAFLGLLSHFPFVESLDLMSLDGLCSTDISLWSTMSSMMIKIRFLSMRRCNVFNLTQLKFPLMTSFSVEKIGYTNHEAWEEFNKNNPNLSFLVINSVPRKPKFDAIRVAATLRKLLRLEYFSTHLL